MSTVPGDETWNDAGLADPDANDPVSLGEEATRPVPSGGEDYHPETARPDLRGAADQADVIDQSYDVPSEEEDFGEAQD